MKQYAFTKNFVGLLLTCSFLFVSCDIVEEPFRKSGGPVEIDTTKPKILLEEFTGHRCHNCPAAHKRAKELAALYPDNFITVAIHSGHFAIPYPTGDSYRYDFRTSVGNELTNYYSVTGYPTGMINRTRFNGQFIHNPPQWDGNITEFLANNQRAELKIELSASYNSASRAIETNVKLDYLSSQINTNRISVWVVEDGIINWQKDGELDVPDYVHSNALRYSFNGTWGDVVSAISIPVNATYNFEYSYTLPQSSDWKPENLKIVAFVYDDENGVKQVEQVKVVIK